MSGDPSPTAPLRVLHCPSIVGGHAAVLARAERGIGLQSHCLSFAPHPFGYEVDETLWRADARQLTRELKGWTVLWRALRQYDVIHFNFGSGILPSYISPRDPRIAGQPRALRYALAAYRGLVEFLDVRLLRRAGKGLVVTYQGNDARLGDYCRKHFAIHVADEVEPAYYHPIRDHHKARRAHTFGRLAHQVISLNPDLMHVLPDTTRFMPYANIDPADWQPLGPVTPPDRPPIVAHAPSHRGVKGSRFIIEAAERLKAEGVPFELRLIEGLPHPEARRAYEQADLFIDQLLLGWYGGVAVELMALAKPVICYIREDDLRFIPPEMAASLPLIQATPRTIYDVLKAQLLEHRASWPAVGRAGRRFVERWHDPHTLARQMREIYLSALARKRDKH